MSSSIFDALGEALKQSSDAFCQALNGGSVDNAQKNSAPMPDIHVEVKPGQASGAVPLTCPNCDASIMVPADRNVSFCAYCGSQLLVDDGSAEVTYRTVDETRIRELEINRQLELKRMEIEERRRPGRLKLMATLAIIGVLMIVVGGFVGHASGDSNSPWYMVAGMGVLPFLAVEFIWIDISTGKGK